MARVNGATLLARALKLGGVGPVFTLSGHQILPIDWKGITRRGNTRTNYQVLPGDRVFVMSQPLTKFDTVLGRMLAPVERVLGVALLGVSLEQIANGESVFGGGDVTNVNVAR